MKVCLINESFPPVIDGVANVLLNYADHLIDDHQSQVIVGTPAYPNADYDRYRYPVVPYHSIDTAAFASGYRAGNPFASRAVGKLAEFAPDIIHSHCPASATVMARILREQTGAPLIFTYHTKYDIDIERWVKVQAIANEGIKAMVSNIEACDEIWVVSRGAGESLKGLGFQGDYRVMNNGVDFAKGRVDQETVEKETCGYDLPADIPVFLFVGRIITYKGLPLILDALKRVHEKGQDFRMVFIGKGPDRELLEEKAAALGIADKCIFVGPIYDRDKLRAWNTRADLFLFPSTFDTNGLVVREAAACGLASVLIRDSCAAEGITDGRNGFIIEENDQAMAELLLKVAGNLDYLHEVGQHAMDEIYLSWKDAVSEVYDRYQIILDRKKSGLLPAHKSQFTDILVSATAHTMEEKERYRRLRHEIFNDFRETAVGMMENIEEVTSEMKLDFEDAKADVKAEFEGAKAEVKAGFFDRTASVRAVYEDAKAAVKNEIEDTRAGARAELEETRASLKEASAELKEAQAELKAGVRAELNEARAEWKEAQAEIKAAGTELRHQIHSFLDLPDRKA